VNALRRDDIEEALRAKPEERLHVALQMMRFGIEMKRAQLMRRFPDESPERIRERLDAWLAAERP
jgi:hypothetical protein